MLAESDILRLIAKPETFRVEVKRARVSVPETFWETYSSFANTDGGVILLGNVVHADYHGRQGVVVERSFREMTISNPGTMRVPREEAIEGGRSDPRNASIFNIFSLINIGDRSGTGFCDHFARWERLGLPKPQLGESYDPARTSLSFVLSLPAGGKVKATGGREKSREKLSSTRGLTDLPASSRQVYAALQEDGTLTYEGLKVKLGFSTATIAKAIGLLVANGYIKREGSRKEGYWKS